MRTNECTQFVQNLPINWRKVGGKINLDQNQLHEPEIVNAHTKSPENSPI